MINKIKKFVLTSGFNCIELPASSIPLQVGMQHGSVTLWIQVPQIVTDSKECWFSTKDDPVIREFFFDVVLTGMAFETWPDSKYLGSAISDDFVAHVYQMRCKPANM